MAVVQDLTPESPPASPWWQKHQVRSLASAFLILLIAIVVIPILQSMFGPISTIRLDEHRNLAAAPNVSSLFSSMAARFAEEANAWFEDRIGFRDVAIRWAHELDARLFAVYRKVYVGPDGWLFERTTTNRRLQIERLTEEQYEAVERSFSELADRLRERGIRLILVDYPDKSEFYPEYLPANLPNLPVQGRLARLRRALDHNPRIIRIDVAELLRPLKAAGKPLFYKTDIHVNYDGTVPVVKEIIRRIARLEGRDVDWDEPLHRRLTPWDGGSEGRSLALMKPVTELIPYAPDFYQIGGAATDGQWSPKDTRSIDYPDRGSFPIIDWEFISDPQRCRDRLPATALFGNSFSDLYWSVGFQRYFCRIRRARTPVERLPAYIDDLPPETRYFIFQYIGAFLPGAAPSPARPERSVIPDQLY